LPYSTFRFDVFELRPHERVLYRDQAPTSLGARAVDVLTVLVMAQGRLVGKAELLEKVWPGLVVEENNLQVQISALRKQLGASAIATVPGRGYRFCLPVRVNLRADEDLTPQLAHAWPTDASPPPARVGLKPGLIPAVGALVGREGDLLAIGALGRSPLITLVGPAGIGKTTLCLALASKLADQSADGAVWVDLTSVADPSLVSSTVLQSVGISPGSPDPIDTLVQALAGHELLLVIDNAEHLQEAVARMVRAILRGAPRIRMLVTSQLPLRVEGERIYRLGPLKLPQPGEADEVARQHGAVALFVDEVKALHRPFEADGDALARVVRICRRLDGLPLAIKLAAARVPVLGLQGVEERLDERFKLLQTRAGTAATRQQTLLAALDWSHDLLSEAERAVFRRLAVASGSFSIELARRLAGDLDMDEWGVIDLLADLVDRSLVIAEGDEWPRYRLLDSMRDYAGLKLADAGEAHDTCLRHARAMADRLDRAYDAYWREPDGQWLAQYGPDLDNVRKALEWASRHDGALAVQLAGAAAPLFQLMGFHSEGRRRFAAVRPQAELGPAGAVQARFWLELARSHWGIDMAGMRALGERALAIYRQERDARGVFMALRCVAGSALLPERDAWPLLTEMAALEQPNWPARLATQRQLAEISVLMACDRMADARRVCQTLLVRAQSAGLEGVARSAMRDIASASLGMGDLDTALDTCQALLAGTKSRRDPFLIHAQAIVGCIAIVRRDVEGARRALSEMVSASALRGWDWLGHYTPLLALLAGLERRMEAAARLLGRAKAVGAGQAQDVLSVYALSRATSLVQDAMPADELAQLEAEGRDMSGEAVASWALGHALPPSAVHPVWVGPDAG
jgi:predicted ATPase/DNA-binding winged helix-turn-helix (wHTH) protein